MHCRVCLLPRTCFWWHAIVQAFLVGIGGSFLSLGIVVGSYLIKLLLLKNMDVIIGDG